MNRRSFIQSGVSMIGALAVLPAHGGEQKLKLGILGTGNWGTEVVLTSALASGKFEIIALCDVNSIALQQASERVIRSGAPAPMLFSSYTEMYAIPDLQAVAIVTPTHWHALQFIDACKRGLHVFLEKPVSYDILESQAMLAAHRSANNIVQVDFPRMKGTVNKEVKAFIESGQAGKIYQAKANINHHEGQLINHIVPPTLDYDHFCGPAGNVPFKCEHGATPMWRGQRAFSRGILFDWGIHYIHNARKVLDLPPLTNVMAMGGIAKNTSHDNPDHLDVQFDFGGFPLLWTHNTWGFTSPFPDQDYGVYYYGDKATIFAGDMGWEVYNKSDGSTMVNGDIIFNPGDPQKWKWYLAWCLDLLTEFAVQVNRQSNDGITNKLEDAITTTNTVIYADMAYSLKSSLTIDHKNIRPGKSDPMAQLLQRHYHTPYRHPYTLAGKPNSTPSHHR